MYNLASNLLQSIFLPDDAAGAAWDALAVAAGAQPPSASTLLPCRIVMVSGGCYHSLCLSNDGRVCAFGRNNHGQLGLEGAHDRVYSCDMGVLRHDSNPEGRTVLASCSADKAIRVYFLKHNFTTI